MAIQGSQNLSSVTIRQPDLVSQDRDADYDAFSEISNTAVLG